MYDSKESIYSHSRLRQDTSRSHGQIQHKLKVKDLVCRLLQVRTCIGEDRA